MFMTEAPEKTEKGCKEVDFLRCAVGTIVGDHLCDFHPGG